MGTSETASNYTETEMQRVNRDSVNTDVQRMEDSELSPDNSIKFLNQRDERSSTQLVNVRE